MKYSGEFLREIADSANIPWVEWKQYIFKAKDGWKVEVFYDAGDFDYLDSFISPAGKRIEIEIDETPEYADLRNWEPLGARQ